MSSKPVSQRIVEFFKPFLLHTIGENLATKTLHRQRDHPWLLGRECIERCPHDARLRKMSADNAIAHKIEGREDTLIWPGITQAQQQSFDAT